MLALSRTKINNHGILTSATHRREIPWNFMVSTCWHFRIRGTR